MKHGPASRRRQRGISLIEALIALAIMAVGMLGILGVQSTLRSTSDVAKQRSEATRIAQVEIERWRAFMALAGGPGVNYNDLPAGPVTDPPIVGANATYVRTRTVSLLPTPRVGKSISVVVTWLDRSNEGQRVQLTSMIAGITPDLTLSMVVPGAGDLIQQPKGRKGGIPIGAKDLGGGKSGWIPPNSPTGTAWVFNNITGLITLCVTTATNTAALVLDPANPANPANNITCGTDLARYIGGFVRYALGFAQPTTANALNPPSMPMDSPATNAVTVQVDYVFAAFPFTAPCYVTHVNSSPSAYTEYHCAVPVVVVVPNVLPSWTGTLWFGPSGYFSSTLADTASSRMKACRYQGNASYANQVEPLANQNHLLTRSGDGATTSPVAYTCPAPTLPQQPLT